MPHMAGETTPTGTREQKRVMGLGTATGICIASMIGMGVFTVTGVVGPELVSNTNVLLVWVVCGLLAFCGAISVAEIGAMRPRASAQYLFVHEALGPTVGYINGIITSIVGYIASIAVVAIVAGIYLEGVFPQLDFRITATVILIVLTCIHGFTVGGGTWVNNVLVVLKIGLVVFFIITGFAFTADPVLLDPQLLEAVKVQRPELLLASMPEHLDAAQQTAFLQEAEGPFPFSATIGGAIAIVVFAYLGWSNSCDVGGEVKKPERNLPVSVLFSVGLVTLMYLLINVAYLRFIPPAAMLEVNAQGEVVEMANLGAVVAQRMFGDVAGDMIGLAIFALLVSTLSTVTMTSARVISAMAWKMEIPRVFGSLSRRGAPLVAMCTQALIAIPIIWISGLSSLLEYIGILLTILVSITMTSIIVMRVRKPDEPRPFRIPFFPIPPLIYIAVTIWLIISSIIDDPYPLLASVGTILVCLLLKPVLRQEQGHSTLQGNSP